MVTVARRVARVRVIRPQQVSQNEINNNNMLYFQAGMLMTKAEMQDHNLSVSRY